ncbi:MAG: GNAT family N-acetyltransferase [Rhizobiaceae bacterium]
MSRDGMFFHAAREGDAEQLCGLARQLATSEGGMPERISPEWILKHMLPTGGPVRVLVAEREGRLAGYLAWSPMVETIFASAGAYVSDLVVDAGHRGRGIGRRLLAMAAADARGHGLQHLWLVTGKGNRDSDRFYRRIANIRQEAVGFAFADETFTRLADEGRSLPTPNRDPSNEDLQ